MRYLLPLLLLLAFPSYAKTVYHDNGGSLNERLEEMERLEGVVIKGNCYSACTLYLGLPETCVYKRARLGFHSPSTKIGLPMLYEAWEEATQILAANYPPKIAEWYLRVGRYSKELIVISGEEAIRLGAKECKE
jgi:hypothetical protein